MNVLQLKAATSGVGKMVGFSLGILLLAITGLIAIPTMVVASGPDAWANIAIGQALGGVGAISIAYGWILSGPSDIARAGTSQRRIEYYESFFARLILTLPVGAVCSIVVLLCVQAHQGLAVLGALSTAGIGLTASWYFVGTGQPYRLLILETIPRAAGTVIGIVLMKLMGTAAAGLISQLAGMLVGVAACSLYILCGRRSDTSLRAGCRPLMKILGAQRYGVIASSVSAAYGATPILVVGLVAPGSLPIYALLDKLQKQLGTTLSAYVQVFQGWVPRAGSGELGTRVRVSLVSASLLGAMLLLTLPALLPPLMSWLGSGSIEIQESSIVLVSAVIALAMFESNLAKSCLIPCGLLASVAHITLVMSVVGLAAMILAANIWGINGLLSTILCGLLMRVLWEMVCLVRHRSQGET